MKLNLNHTQTYVLAISGGIDSMVLLDLFIKAEFSIVVVHFDHQKRSDSSLDHELIQAICLNHKIPYYLFKLNLDDKNFQANARASRQHHLEEVATLHQTNSIVTAHHLDDLIETVLIKMIRGASFLGLSGIRFETIIHGFSYLKPLINYSKDEIMTYAAENNIQYLEDSTNSSNLYLRNQIRNSLVPILTTESEIRYQIQKLSDLFYQTHLFIRQQSLTFLSNQTQFSLPAFMHLNPIIQADIIAYLLESINFELKTSLIDEIIKQLSSEKANLLIKLGNGFCLVRNYEQITLTAYSDINKTIEDFNLIISHKMTHKDKGFTKICYNSLDFPLILRFRQSGDLLRFNYGTKKLKDFLIDQKVPLQQRDQLPIVTDSSNQIIWIPGLYLNPTIIGDNTIYLKIKGAHNAQ